MKFKNMNKVQVNPDLDEVELLEKSFTES